MKTKTTIRYRIATRAYFAWLNGSTAGATADWLAAEVIELGYAERRAAAAKKAAGTRRANEIVRGMASPSTRARRAKAAAKAPAAVAAAAAARRPTNRLAVH